MAKLLDEIKGKKTHKKTIARDVLLIETGHHTGLRRDELADLMVGDLQLSSCDTQLLVKEGKGGKARTVPLNDYIRGQLSAFTKNMKSNQSVFGLVPKTISLKIGNWARKAGIPVHTHSLRHKFATDILDAGGNIHAVQQLWGHESLGTTESYLAVTDKGLQDAVRLLDKGRQNSVKDTRDQLDDTQSSEIEMQKPYQETPHKQKMREVAEVMAERIRLPSHFDKDLWRDLPVEFKPGKYYLPIGTVKIGKNNEIEVTYYDIRAGIAEPHLVEGLYSHLSTSGLTRLVEIVGDNDGINNLVTITGQYSHSLIMFLKLIMDEVNGGTEKIWFHGEQKSGLKKEFITTIWCDAIQKAGGHTWIGKSWYKPCESVPDTKLLQLKCGAFIIGIAENERTLETYEAWHKKLRGKYAKHVLANNLAVKNEAMSTLAQKIRQRLQEFADLQHLPGHCELC
ncbi:tyrosine-type recombinase/integrase [Chloroflexota bacterium]